MGRWGSIAWRSWGRSWVHLERSGKLGCFSLMTIALPEGMVPTETGKRTGAGVREDSEPRSNDAGCLQGLGRRLSEKDDWNHRAQIDHGIVER